MLPSCNYSQKLINVSALEASAAGLAKLLKDFALKAILFQGELGSGKTTFTRALVQALPGGHMAEVSSPSFTLCNSYKTTPQIMHCDLYRAAYSVPDEVWDGLEDAQTLCIIEWAEYLPTDVFSADSGQDYLYIHLKICEEGRLMEATAHGNSAKALLDAWKSL